jgi:GH25 family lysozyme M1 (1,4-beta-N-acetylmuramidase)
MLTYGIDVSDAQAEELPGVTPGIEFAMIKATEGHSYVSPVQKAQAAAGRKHGRVIGFYHFLWPGNIGLQAQYFVEQCASVPGDILAVDWEQTSDNTHASNAEKDQFIRAVKLLRPHHRVMLYCNRDFWLNHDSTSECGDGLWIADYTDAGKPRIKAHWVLHQFSDGGGNVDRDVYNGSPAQLHTWARGLL